MNSSKKNKLWIYLTLVISLFIDLYMFPDAVMHLKPLITLLVLIYWNMALPKDIGLIWAMIFGFCLDVNKEILLGSHVLLFLLISFLTQRYFHRLRALYMIQQSLFVAVVILIYQIFLILFFSEFRQSIFLELILLTLLSSLLWPFIFGILRQLRIKIVQSS